MSFAEAFAFTLGEEGGYVNDPVDRGGATNYGVTQDTYNRFRDVNNLGRQAVRNITRTEVEHIYRKFYWDDGQCEFINQHSSRLALLHFDACINHGLRNAAKVLQRALGFTGSNVDGLWGPMTRGAIAAHKDLDELIRRQMEKREDFYIDIVVSNNSQLKFFRGWLYRVRRLRRKVLPCG